MLYDLALKTGQDRIYSVFARVRHGAAPQGIARDSEGTGFDPRLAKA